MRCSFTLNRVVFNTSLIRNRSFSTNTSKFANYDCKLLVVGGGSGGCAVAAKFSKHFKKSELVVLDGAKYHYYQPYFTLIGGGTGSLSDCRRDQKSVLPNNCTWIQQNAQQFDLKNNKVYTIEGDCINYDYLLVATGLELHYEQIPGLEEALKTPGSGVCSNYSPKYVNLTFETLKKLDKGNAIFTFPNSPVKCPGAPQKICYITEEYLRLNNKRQNVKIIYNTSLPVIFGVKVYADALWKVCKERDIEVNVRTNLIRINHDKREAVFENLDKPEQKTTLQYSMIHVTPPMSTPKVIKENKDLSNEAGFVDVNKDTLQHVRYKNVFAIGDCSSTPNSKTAAAAAAQSKIVYDNLSAEMSQKPLTNVYDGYASCPLVTGYDKCILAEFDYNLNPLETFPISQDRELKSMYLLKKHFMPPIYWKLMMNGYWNGPAAFRKLMHLQLTEKRA